MAFEGMGPQVVLSLKAAADLSAAANQFKFVKLDVNGDVVAIAAATDKPVGVLQNKPVNLGTAEVLAVGVSKVRANGAVTFGDSIGTAANGEAAKKTHGTDITHFVCGQAITDAAAAGDYFTAEINCMSPTRAA